MNKTLLPALIASALTSPAVLGQDSECIDLQGTPPGLYATTDEGRTFLIKDDQVVEMGPGQAGFADGERVACVNKPPAFLNWPCSTQAARSRKFATYEIADITESNILQEIVRRYFEIPEVIEPVPKWIDGEYHGVFNYQDLLQFSSPEYWYVPDNNRPFLDPKRPRSLQVSLFVGINRVVVDSYAMDALHSELGADELPVTFTFNDTNSVPVSYFGENVSVEEIMKAFSERGIKLAEVPVWWLGDHHIKATTVELESLFDIPALSEISPSQQAALREDIEKYGFTRKPIIINAMAESGTMAVDQPQRVRMAAEMGFRRIPVVFNFVEPDQFLARCGPGTPAGSSGAISGGTTPIGGALVPPGTAIVPPDPEEPASGS